MNKKWLFHFEVIREIHEKEETTSTNDKGEEVTTKKDVTKKTPVTLALQKPNRKMYEAGEMFYAVKLSEGIKAGLLTKPLLAKRYKDDGGPLSDDEKSRYAELFYEMASKQDEIEKLRLNLESRSEEKRTKAAQELMADIMTLREELQEYELAQSSLFDQTAENRAKNQTIMWWVLSLAYEKSGETRYSPVFGDGDYDSKLDRYDEIEDTNEPFWTEVVKKMAYFVTFWYLNGITDEKEFKEIEKLYAQEAGYFDENVEDDENVEGESSEGEPEAEEKKEKPKAKEKKEKPKAKEKKEKPKAKEKKEEPKAEEKKEEPKAEEKKEEPKAEEKKEEPKAEPATSVN